MAFWRGKNKFSYIENVGTAIGFGAQKDMEGGKTYFVNCNTGSDGYSGRNPNNPLATLEAAEAKCVTAKHDYIIVQDFWTLTTESPIVFNKTDMHVISLGSGILFDNGNDIDSAAANAAVQLEGCTDLELAGFNIGGSVSGASYDAITVVGTTFRVHLHHCTFGNNYACLNGIGEGAVGNMGKWLVEDCFFGAATAGDGINCSSLSSMVRNCLFYKVALKGIDLPAGQTWNKYLNNQFYSSIALGHDSGWGITLRATCADNMVYGSRAADTGDSAGNEPYRDESTDSVATMLNSWCDNMWGADQIAPDKSDS